MIGNLAQRVVVGGGGIAGLTAANLLREAGADVLVAAPRELRRGSVMVERGAWSVLERAGAADLLAGSPLDASGRHRMVAIRALEDALEGRARATGVRIERSDAFVVNAQTSGDRVRVGLSGARDGAASRTVDADWYVDATGGSSSVARSETFRRDPFVGTFRAYPTERRFEAVHAPAIPGAPIGWSGANGAFAINDVRSGVLSVYRGVDADATGSAGVLDASVARQLLADVHVPAGEHVEQPFGFVARQALARSAGEGRVLIAGDGAGTVLPVRQAGVLLAALDAERAASLIASRPAAGERTAAAVRAYDEQTRTMHRLFLA